MIVNIIPKNNYKEDFMKKIIFIFIFNLLILSLINAHSDGREHDYDLRNVLYGTTDIYNSNINVEKAEILESACYLAIDFCKGQEAKGQRSLNKLELDRIISIESIVTPGGPSHERYTHLGWDEKFYHGGKKSVATWILRRDQILLYTVENLFYDISASKKEYLLFAQLCYYVHIIGDHEDNTSRTRNDRMMLVRRANVSKENPCIIDELIRIVNELFKGQNINSLIFQLQGIKDSARTIDDSTEAGIKKVQDFAFKTMKILRMYIPDLLLEKEFFFNNIFVFEEEILAA